MRDALDVDRLLDGAAKAVKSVRYCWLLTAAEVRRRWTPGYDTYFPSAEDRASAVFVEIAVERMDLWIRGVTPEPFGLKTTTLERDPAGAWRVA